MRFGDIQEEHIQLLSDSSKYNPDIASELGIGLATVSRWRKKLGITWCDGRKSKDNGGTYKTYGRYIKCKMCDNLVYYQPNEIGTKHKCCSRKCLFSDPDYRQKLLDADKSYTREPGWGKWACKDDVPEYRKYRNRVNRLTERVYCENIDLINPDRHPRTLCGVDGGWQLDHIKPVRQCFDEGLTPDEASQLSNLRMLPWLDNLLRNYN